MEVSYTYNSNKMIPHVLVLIKRFIDFIYMLEAACERYKIVIKFIKRIGPILLVYRHVFNTTTVS